MCQLQFIYIEISWCEKQSSQYFFSNVDVWMSVQYDICLQWGGFGFLLVIYMSMDTENRLNKVVSK